MNDLFASPRCAVRHRYALLTPSSLVPSALPGWENALCHVVVSPALGARFSQLLITLQNDGLGKGNTGRNQYLLYLLEGDASILVEDRRHRLETGSYAYVPPAKDLQIKSGRAATRLLVFQREYGPLPGTPAPAAFVAHEREVKAQALAGAPGARAQSLLPAQPAFDLAANILTFQPGAGLPALATPIMERGFMLLRGQGLVRLGPDWHPVLAGDIIWTAPYCPQWFVAIGNAPASYICCEDANRDPM